MSEKRKSTLDIAWFGMDGLLVASYFAAVAVILYGIIARNDFIIGYLVPYAIMIAVTGIFINYLSHVCKFATRARKPGDK